MGISVEGDGGRLSRLTYSAGKRIARVFHLHFLPIWDRFTLLAVEPLRAARNAQPQDQEQGPMTFTEAHYDMYE